jgi:hypothetical protein
MLPDDVLLWDGAHISALLHMAFEHLLVEALLVLELSGLSVWGACICKWHCYCATLALSAAAELVLKLLNLGKVVFLK